jgi:Mrp family chromosome partitioning ATPase
MFMSGFQQEDHLKREAVAKEQLRERMGLIKHKVLVLSGKGGVGKSTVAVNIAVSLAMSGKNVGLLDVDIHGPSVPKILKLEEERAKGIDEQLLAVKVNKNLSVMSVGFMLPRSDSAVIWRGPMKYNVIRQFLKDVEWGELDYLIVDCPPGTGDEPLSVGQLIEGADGAVVVTTPQELALNDVRKSITFCRELGLRVLGVLENMSGFVCPGCGERVDIFKLGGAEAMATELAVPFLGSIPLDKDIVESCDSGDVYVEKFVESKAAVSFKKVIISLEEIVSNTD